MISEYEFRRADLEQRLSGVIVPVITPFSKGEIDPNSMSRMISWLVTSEVRGLFFLGHTGEFQYLSQEQKKRVINIATRADTGKNVKVFVGTTGETIDETIELTGYARQKGVNAVVIAPKYKTIISTFDYLKRVLDASPGPVILYNHPAITDDKEIMIDDLQKLFEIPKYKKMVIGIKDSSANPEYFAQLLELRNRSHPKMAVFQGSESALIGQHGVSEHYRRYDGIVSGSANHDPRLILGIYKSIHEGFTPFINILPEYLKEYKEDGDAIRVIKRKAREVIFERQPLIKSDELAPRKAA